MTCAHQCLRVNIDKLGLCLLAIQLILQILGECTQHPKSIDYFDIRLHTSAKASLFLRQVYLSIIVYFCHVYFKINFIKAFIPAFYTSMKTFKNCFVIYRRFSIQSRSCPRLRSQLKRLKQETEQLLISTPVVDK